jgi:hypothetical protein
VADVEIASSATPEEREHQRSGLKLLSVELDKWSPIGPEKITLDIADRRTVLIGRNGAGKSALIDGILLGLDDSLRGPRIGPRGFKAKFEDAEGKRIVYEHSWEPVPQDPTETAKLLAEGQEAGQQWAERCWYEGSEDKPLWSMKDGRAFIGEREIAVPEHGSVPTASFSKGIDTIVVDPAYDLRRKWFTGFCSFAKRVDAGIPHAREPRDGAHERTDQIYFYKQKKTSEAATTEEPKWTLLAKMPRRFTRVFSKIFQWSREDAETGYFSELRELGRRIGAFQEFEIPIMVLPDGGSFAQVVLDGENAGNAADGTLRLVEILYAMLRVGPGSIMLLEEPETGVHPGALISLLNVLDSYAVDRQFLLSSHSPVVIGQVKPEELRIVYRREGQTHVRPLDASELDRAASFLSQEGTLDEFMLSGAIDES